MSNIKQERKDRIMQMYASGLNFSEIARELHVTKQAVQQLVAREYMRNWIKKSVEMRKEEF